MGYIAHDAVVVTTLDGLPDFPLPDIDAFRASLPEEMRPLVVGPIRAPFNSYVTYVFAPDGSKEGWGPSDRGDECREQFKDLFRGTYDDGSSPMDWVAIRFGGDFAKEGNPEISEFHPTS
jgi:hypothetical protein